MIKGTYHIKDPARRNRSISLAEAIGQGIVGQTHLSKLLETTDTGASEYEAIKAATKRQLISIKPLVQALVDIALEDGRLFPEMPEFPGYVLVTLDGIRLMSAAYLPTRLYPEPDDDANGIIRLTRPLYLCGCVTFLETSLPGLFDVLDFSYETQLGALALGRGLKELEAT